jgi:hypothetical protein
LKKYEIGSFSGNCTRFSKTDTQKNFSIAITANCEQIVNILHIYEFFISKSPGKQKPQRMVWLRLSKTFWCGSAKALTNFFNKLKHQPQMRLVFFGRFEPKIYSYYLPGKELLQYVLHLELLPGIEETG